MPSSVPPALAACLDQCLTTTTPSQCLVTSVLGASANWLVLRIISATLNSTVISQISPGADGGNPCVVFVSFTRSLEVWSEMGRKINLDIASLVTNKRLAYVDGLTGGAPSNSTAGLQPQSLRSHTLRDLQAAIADASNSLRGMTGKANARSVLVMDGIDFVLASQSDIDHQKLQQVLLQFQADFDTVVLTASSDNPLLHNTDATATPLERDHSMFVRTASYMSTHILQVRPLETGSAKDVSGVCRISPGGSYDGATGEPIEGEWLYEAKGDGSLRMWNRGE